MVLCPSAVVSILMLFPKLSVHPKVLVSTFTDRLPNYQNLNIVPNIERPPLMNCLPYLWVTLMSDLDDLIDLCR